MNFNLNKKGFVLLYAILVASIISVSSIAIASIIFKQLVVSSVGQNSQIAYYSSYVGLGCAKLWTSGDMGGDQLFDFDSPSSFSIECLNDQPPSQVSWDGLGYYKFTIENITGSSCSHVLVYKEEQSILIYSYGYNVEGTDGTCLGSHPRKVERLIQTNI